MQPHSRNMSISRATLANGPGWSVSEATFLATSPQSCFEGRHIGVNIVAVTAGSFRYHATHGCFTLMPGALMIGNAGDTFACRYDGSWGDRCISFNYAPDYFERIDAGRAGRQAFRTHRLAPTPAVIALIAEL